MTKNKKNKKTKADQQRARRLPPNRGAILAQKNKRKDKVSRSAPKPAPKPVSKPQLSKEEQLNQAMNLIDRVLNASEDSRKDKMEKLISKKEQNRYLRTVPNEFNEKTLKTMQSAMQSILSISAINKFLEANGGDVQKNNLLKKIRKQLHKEQYHNFVLEGSYPNEITDDILKKIKTVLEYQYLCDNKELLGMSSELPYDFDVLLSNEQSSSQLLEKSNSAFLELQEMQINRLQELLKENEEQVKNLKGNHSEQLQKLKESSIEQQQNFKKQRSKQTEEVQGKLEKQRKQLKENIKQLEKRGKELKKKNEEILKLKEQRDQLQTQEAQMRNLLKESNEALGIAQVATKRHLVTIGDKEYALYIPTEKEEFFTKLGKEIEQVLHTCKDEKDFTEQITEKVLNKIKTPIALTEEEEGALKKAMTDVYKSNSFWTCAKNSLKQGGKTSLILGFTAAVVVVGGLGFLDPQAMIGTVTPIIINVAHAVSQGGIVAAAVAVGNGLSEPLAAACTLFKNIHKYHYNFSFTLGIVSKVGSIAGVACMVYFVIKMGYKVRKEVVQITTKPSVLKAREMRNLIRRKVEENLKTSSHKEQINKLRQSTQNVSVGK